MSFMRKNKWTSGCVKSVAVFITLLALSSVNAASLQWSPNAEADLAGYRIHWGASSGSYTQAWDVGNVTTWPVPESQPNGYFAATAYDIEGLESGYSNEVLYTRDVPLPPVAATGLVVVWTPVAASTIQTDWIGGESVIIYNPTPEIDADWSSGQSFILDKKGP